MSLLPLSRERLAAVVAGLVVLGILGAAGNLVVRGSYLGPAAELQEDIDAARASLNRQKKALRDAADVGGELDAFAARSLGATRESVDHALRSRLGDLAEQAGITGAIVSTRGWRELPTPMRSALPRRGIWRELRDEPDLGELTASISGEASYPQVLALLAGLTDAPWPRRINGFRLDPRRGGSLIGFRLDVTTGYLPGRVASADARAEALSASSDPAATEAIAAAVVALASADRFRLPPPPTPPPAPPVRVAEKPEPKPGPPPFPWGNWTLTGVATGPDGDEAWLRRGDNGQRAVLAPGDAFQTVQLMSVDADGAVFGLGDARVRIVIGETLAAAGRIK